MIIGSFRNEAARDEAVARLRSAGFGAVTRYGPMPPEDERSPLPLVMLAAGVLGAAGAFGLQAYATGIAYPMNIGGRPNVFWPSYIPFTFEVGALCAMAAGFLAYVIVNRMPHLYDPVDESQAFRRASIDRWFVVLPDPDAPDRERLTQLLRAAGVAELDEAPSP